MFEEPISILRNNVDTTIQELFTRLPPEKQKNVFKLVKGLL
jgi:hypothetical protein